MKKTPCIGPLHRGFALVVTLALMILLTVIAVGLLTLSTISLRSASQGSNVATAQANARMALILAIGDLQKNLGPDQRISITADQRIEPNSDGSQTSSALGNRQWTGVFESWPATSTDRPTTPVFLSWLVSGESSKFSQLSAATSQLTGPDIMEMVGAGTLGAVGTGQVKVPVMNVKDGSALTGRMAWWVGDQGVKASVATQPTSEETTLGVLRGNLQSAPRNAFELAAAGTVKPFASVAVNDPRMRFVTSWQQAGLLVSDPKSHRPLFHDLAASSTGLLTNVRAGGFRKDLSMKLETYVTASGAPSPPKLTDPANVLYSINSEPGINFQELWAYYQLYKQLQTSGGGAFTTGGSIAAKTPFLRIADGPAAISRDYWHFFKQPVIISYKFVLSFSMRNGLFPNVGKKVLCVDFDPLITLWNPLDVPVVLPRNSFFIVDYWHPPYDVTVNINGTGNKSCSLVRSRLSRNGASAGLVNFNFLNLNAGKVESLVLKPGEVLHVSQMANTAVTSGLNLNYPLDGKKGFNFGGGCAVPLITNTGEYILLDPTNPTESFTYSARATNVTAGNDSSGGNLIPGAVGHVNTRRWSLTHINFYIGEELGSHVGIGLMGLDWCYGYNRPTRDDETNVNGRHRDALPLFNKTASNSTRLYARNFPDIYPPIQGAQDTRPITAASIDGRKAPFMVISHNAKTEMESKRGNRYLSHFNPKAFHVDFYNLSQQERDLLPYEVSVTPLTSWLNAPVEENIDGNGFFGTSLKSELGSSFVTTHTVPREPIVSLAAFQNSFANGFNFLTPAPGTVSSNDREPMQPQIAHAIGNSTAPSMLAADKTEGALPNNPNPLADHSYLANRALWDDYFLSGVTPQNSPSFVNTRDQKTVATEFFTGVKPVPVARYLPYLDGQDSTALVSSFFSGTVPTTTAINNLASYLRVDGLFNVNSTSIEAWKIVLGSLKGRQVVVRDAKGAESIAPADANTPVANHAAPYNVIAKDEATLKSDSQWVGRRTLTDAEIDELARAIVKEVRKRGPFLSLADFVNRRVGTDKALARAGAIQSALDGTEVTINKNNNTGRAVANATAARFAFPEAEQGARTSGAPAVVKQGDILTPIAPVLSARSDSFIIRAYGEAVDSRGNTTARAWCEAVVERNRNFVDTADKAETLPVNANATNKVFGRRFNLVSFRWLNSNEI